MKSFLVEIPTYQILVFLIYGLIFIPLGILLLRQKMIKSREVRY